MLFNSIDFAVFLPLVFSIYWLLNKRLKLQNLLLLLSSYLFYGYWDWRFLSLIIFSSLVDYTIGIALSKEIKITKRKCFLWISIIVNIGFLGFFKYYNFFLDNFISAFSFFGSNFSINSVNIILPVGISFYTFQTLSYTIDVYNRKIEPSRDIIAFSSFVSFFPQLVAGPIERAINLLPQFVNKRIFNYSIAVNGLRQILWGFFKKIVIADTCATYTNLIFNDYNNYSGVALLFGAILFAFQIYGDFSGYSDIAIGTSRLFGFNLMQNFNFPYFSRDISEFWRRWHISLSTWFRDYLYIPLGGSRGSVFKKVRNVFIIFIVSGFWHGANWTYIAWGALNAIYFLPLLLLKKNRVNTNTIAINRTLPTFKEFFQMITTFLLVVIAWIFFRSENISDAIEYIYLMIKNTFNKTGFVQVLDIFYLKIGWIFPSIFFLFILIEWRGREYKYAIEKMFLNNKKRIRFSFYYFLVLSIMYFAINGEEQEFIYFQF
jgi:alginate O-acetyltransferase complex protein AlgI